jgi:hypothetical protein
MKNELLLTLTRRRTCVLLYVMFYVMIVLMQLAVITLGLRLLAVYRRIRSSDTADGHRVPLRLN